MMPDKIYIGLTNSEFGGVVYNTVSAIFPNAKEYIRKDALMEWANERLEEFRQIAEISNNVAADGEVDAFEELIDKLNEV